jgi:GntR family transcriptional repressor for pyruvate dehydrogenase complex
MARTGRRKKAKRTRHDRWWSRPSRLHPLRGWTLAERLADQIRRGILLADLRDGKRLESCRAMAREAQVSVAVVREALAQLRGEGLIQVRHGVGVFVAARPPKARALRAARRSAGRREILELRASLEPIAAAAAAGRATDARMLELRLLLGERELARRFGDSRSFATAEVDFHRAVFKMSGNRLVAAGAELAGSFLGGHVAANAWVIAEDDRLQALHAQLTDAIEKGRPSLARRAAQAIAAREGELAARPP